MRKKLVFILLTLVIIVTGAVLAVWYLHEAESKHSARSSVTRQQPEKKLIISDLDLAFVTQVTGYDLNKKVPGYTGVDYLGQEFRLDDQSGKNRLLFFGALKCDNCVEYYPILKDWAKKYKSTLEVIVFYNDAISEDMYQDLSESSIKVIPCAESAFSLFNAGQVMNTFMVDQNGYLVHYFDFHENEWKEIDSIIHHFALSGQLAEGVVRRNYIRKDELLPEIPVLKELSGGPDFEIDKLTDKPSIIYLSDTRCKPCESLYALINKVNSIYNDQIYQVLFLVKPFQREDFDNGREYYDKYDLPVPEFYKNPKISELPASPVLIPTYYGLESARQSWGIGRMPSAIVLDGEQRVVEYLPMGTGYGEGALCAEEHVMEICKELLQREVEK